MKRNLKLSMFALFVSIATMSCTNDVASPVNPNSPNLNLQDESGWRVVWYWDKDKDETNNFSQYTFHFKSNGVFEATNSSGTVMGTWRTTSDDGSQRLVLTIGTSKPLSDLTDDWVIVSSTDQSIKLKDDNTTHLEELFFEKK